MESGCHKNRIERCRQVVYGAVVGISHASSAVVQDYVELVSKSRKFNSDTVEDTFEQI